MAADDWLAILYLLRPTRGQGRGDHGDGHWRGPLRAGCRNALALVSLAGKPDIPVACGRETPLRGSHAFPHEWRDGIDQLFGIAHSRRVRRTRNAHGRRAPHEDDRGRPGNVTLLTLGPLTNVAEALQQSPDLANSVKAVFIMGGAVDVGGNVGVSGVGIDNQVAEWNIYCDPLAANVVLDSGAPVTLVPLDATNAAPVTRAFQQRLGADMTTPAAQFASQVLTQLTPAIEGGGYFFWDPLAAAILVDESLTTFETRGLSVETAEGPESGRIIAAPAGKQIRFAKSANLASLEQLFLDTLNGR